MRNALHTILGIPRNAILLLIAAYQHTISPDHGPLKNLFPYGYCRHSPTCSEYAKEVITTKGALIGSFWAIIRVLTCVPWKKPSEQKILEVTKKTLH